MPTIGELVKEYRQKQNLSMQAFGKMCDLSRAYIAILEKGINPTTGRTFTPTIETLEKIAKAMNISKIKLMEITDIAELDLNKNNSGDDFYQPLYLRIGSNIKSFREKHHLTQKEFAQIADVSDKAISSWETGNKLPRIQALDKIAKHFNVPKSIILEGDPISSHDELSIDSKIINILPLLNNATKEKFLFLMEEIIRQR